MHLIHTEKQLCMGAHNSQSHKIWVHNTKTESKSYIFTIRILFWENICSWNQYNGTILKMQRALKRSFILCSSLPLRTLYSLIYVLCIVHLFVVAIRFYLSVALYPSHSDLNYVLRIRKMKQLLHKSVRKWIKFIVNSSQCTQNTELAKL